MQPMIVEIPDTGAFGREEIDVIEQLLSEIYSEKHDYPVEVFGYRQSRVFERYTSFTNPNVSYDEPEFAGEFAKTTIHEQNYLRFYIRGDHFDFQRRPVTSRIETYVHSDSVTPHKGAAVIEVAAQTSFAAITPEFIEFSKKAARIAYAFLAPLMKHGTLYQDAMPDKKWAQLIEEFPFIEDDRKALEAILKETVEVKQIAVMIPSE